MAASKWQRHEDDTYTYRGHGFTISDRTLKEILEELVAGIPVRSVAKKRGLPSRVPKEIFQFFNRLADD